MAQAQGRRLIEHLDPEGLHPTPGYHHVTITDARRTILLAGQCPLDPAGGLVGAGDRLAQTDRIVENTLIALAAAGATPADVVRTVVYVVPDAAGEGLGAVWRRLVASDLGPAFASASTLVGVAALGFDGQLVELDVTAALD